MYLKSIGVHAWEVIRLNPKLQLYHKGVRFSAYVPRPRYICRKKNQVWQAVLNIIHLNIPPSFIHVFCLAKNYAVLKKKHSILI